MIQDNLEEVRLRIINWFDVFEFLSLVPRISLGWADKRAQDLIWLRKGFSRSLYKSFSPQTYIRLVLCINIKVKSFHFVIFYREIVHLTVYFYLST